MLSFFLNLIKNKSFILKLENSRKIYISCNLTRKSYIQNTNIHLLRSSGITDHDTMDAQKD